MAKKLIFVTAIVLKRDSKMVNFMLVGLEQSKDWILKNFKILTKNSKSGICIIYGQNGHKEPQSLNIPKNAKNGQTIDICDFNSPETRFKNGKLYVSGVRQSKDWISKTFEILTKKIQNQVPV